MNLHWDQINAEVKRRTPRASKAAANIILEVAKPLTPRDTGRLVNSGRVEMHGEEARVVFDTDYAAIVHEDMTARHPIGGAKYLERAMKFGNRAALNAMRNEIIG